MRVQITATPPELTPGFAELNWGFVFRFGTSSVGAEGELALWVGCCARTRVFVQPSPRYVAVHQTSLNLSCSSGLYEAAISLLSSHVGATSPLPRGRSSTAGVEGQVRTDAMTSKPVVRKSMNFYSSFLRWVQLLSIIYICRCTHVKYAMLWS